ncbi:kinetochore CENP-C fungal-like protein [Phialemonium atrogriseum]|uniref:CENP-C homolog n=1 Tax=Phialemonium atrogriseum TaxID=1093897 RepID=A0AAJ0BWF2_9PEZI|nr:kinetochore CENP-C fungal-like protein [Phialemonium atrogriseum]KAK1765496.1 kinetochore CENP-C fungal-like protein [Phialemonium atrogriseum]
MAPRTTGSRRTQAQTDRLFELGVQGRKTGVTLRDTGVRDEHGMQPLEDIFSSPEKTARIDTNHAADDDESGDSSGQEMDIENTTAPDPAILMRAHGNTLKVPLPRSRSPIKTYLQSPARQNPHLNPNSSPVRGSIVGPNEPARSQSVKRRLDFSLDATSHSLSQPTTSSSGGRAAAEARPRVNGLRNRRSLQDEDEDVDGADEETILHGEQQEDDSREPEESMAMINDGGDDASDPGYDNEYYDDDGGDVELGEESRNDDDGGDVELGEESRNDEEVVEAEAKSSRRKSQRGGVARNTVPDAAEEEEEEEPVRSKRGRPAKNKSGGEAQQRGSTKRRRSSITAEEEAESEHEPEPEPEPEPERKKQRTGGKPRGRKPAGKTATNTDETGEPSKQTTKPATKGKRGRPRRSSIDAADRSLAVVPRGPPLPKARGLLISRREVPGDSGITRTRSGRNSFRPLAFWRNEHVDYDQDQIMDDAFASRGNPSKFVLPTIKEVHRVEEPELPKRRGRPAKAGSGGAKRKQGKAGGAGGADMFDEPAEAWEEDPGTVVGDAVVWQPEYEYAPPGLDEEIELAPEQLAVSGQAIETRDIRNASFRFAKTLSMPFFGAGVVDLPPGSEKRPKNSRKMYMAFFVFAGRVLVTVNESTFRIGRGGMWFVPRGNIYSIENDYDEPARVFFSQGCEPLQQPVEGEDGAE